MADYRSQYSGEQIEGRLTQAHSHDNLEVLDAINQGKVDSWNAKAEMSDIPTKTSELTNDSGFQTDSQVSDKVTSAIISLDVSDTAVSGKYVSSVSEVDGKIHVERADLPDGDPTEWGEITGDITNQTDLNNALNTKQPMLTAGFGIDINNNTISANDDVATNADLFQEGQTRASNDEQLRQDLDTKVDKVAAQSGNPFVYGRLSIEDGGTEGKFTMSVNSISGAVVKRDSEGRIMVNTTPDQNNEATSKSYVDTKSETAGTTVTQNPTTTNSDFPILEKSNTTGSAVTNTVYFNSNVTANPSTGALKAVSLYENGTAISSKYESLANRQSVMTKDENKYPSSKAVIDYINDMDVSVPVLGIIEGVPTMIPLQQDMDYWLMRVSQGKIVPYLYIFESQEQYLDEEPKYILAAEKVEYNPQFNGDEDGYIYFRDGDKTYRVLLDWDENYEHCEISYTIISDGSGYVETTYSELKELRDNSRLTAGTWYRITDYDTIAVSASLYGQEIDIQVAHHAFDVVVLALSESALSENAKAVQHDGDTYFNNHRIEAWEIHYILDNDQSRFIFADPENGKGCITYMKDANNNECPYDHKNILWKRTEDGVDIWLYTFHKYVDGVITDNSNDSSVCRNTFGDYCYSNTFGEECSSNTFGDGCSYNTFGNECHSNIFGYGCSSNTFGYCCSSNTFGDGFYSNTFGEQCYWNTFGNGCHSNTFGNYCDLNTFGEDCYLNTFGDGFYSNTFGNECYSNIFGYGCSSNTFCDEFHSNTFGDYCNSNTFGDECHSNTFGEECSSNTFGNYCSYNTFGNYCYYNTFGNYCYYNTFGEQCDNIENVNVHSMVCEQTLTFAPNKQYIQHCALNEQGELAYWIDTDVNKKVDYSDVISIQEAAYTAGNVGKYRKVLSFSIADSSVSLNFNVSTMSMGYKQSTTLLVDANQGITNPEYISLRGMYSYGFVAGVDNNIVTVYSPCINSSYNPRRTYDFQIIQCHGIAKEAITWHTSDVIVELSDADIQSTQEYGYRQPIDKSKMQTVSAYNYVASIDGTYPGWYVSKTSRKYFHLTLNVTGETTGQLYTLVAGNDYEYIEIVNASGVVYCRIDDVKANETMSILSASNTADGWKVTRQKPSIMAADESINVDWDESTAMLSVGSDTQTKINFSYIDSLGRGLSSDGNSYSELFRIYYDDTIKNTTQTAEFDVLFRVERFIVGFAHMLVQVGTDANKNKFAKLETITCYNSRDYDGDCSQSLCVCEINDGQQHEYPFYVVKFDHSILGAFSLVKYVMGARSQDVVMSGTTGVDYSYIDNNRIPVGDIILPTPFSDNSGGGDVGKTITVDNTLPTLQSGYTYEIKGDVNINSNLDIPDNVVFNFNGGSLTVADGRTINNTAGGWTLEGDVKIYGSNFTVSAELANEVTRTKWFRSLVLSPNDSGHSINADLLTGIIWITKRKVIFDDIYPIDKPITIGKAILLEGIYPQGVYADHYDNAQYGIFTTKLCDAIQMLDGGWLSLRNFQIVGWGGIGLTQNLYNYPQTASFTMPPNATSGKVKGYTYSISNVALTGNGADTAGIRSICSDGVQCGIDWIVDSGINGFVHGIFSQSSFITRLATTQISCCRFGIMALWSSDFVLDDCHINTNHPDFNYHQVTVDGSSAVIDATNDPQAMMDATAGIHLVGVGMCQVNNSRFEFNGIGAALDGYGHGHTFNGCIFDSQSGCFIDVVASLATAATISPTNPYINGTPSISTVAITGCDFMRGCQVGQDGDTLAGQGYFLLQHTSASSTANPQKLLLNITGCTFSDHCNLPCKNVLNHQQIAFGIANNSFNDAIKVVFAGNDMEDSACEALVGQTGTGRSQLWVSGTTFNDAIDTSMSYGNCAIIMDGAMMVDSLPQTSEQIKHVTYYVAEPETFNVEHGDEDDDNIIEGGEA